AAIRVRGSVSCDNGMGDEVDGRPIATTSHLGRTIRLARPRGAGLVYGFDCTWHLTVSVQSTRNSVHQVLLLGSASVDDDWCNIGTLVGHRDGTQSRESPC